MSQNEATSATAPKHVKCPTCGGDSLYSPANRFRPFCSERCKLIDLGAWASESYRVADTDTPPNSERDPNADG